ncbi:DDE_3 domain-containing protein [Trichonephila clavipes]|nr:DDE_3 domain-containing protein [Trichonephila clavipes]
MLSSRPGAIYQQDNAHPHTTRVSNNVFKDMTSYHGLPGHQIFLPIEHVWDALGRQLQPSRDTGELTAQMQRLWQDLPQGVISDLIESMPRRISACIAARGGFTTY